MGTVGGVGIVGIGHSCAHLYCVKSNLDIVGIEKYSSVFGSFPWFSQLHCGYCGYCGTVGKVLWVFWLLCVK